MVDDNYGMDCSNGLHVGALDYVVGYGHFKKGEPLPEGGNRLLLVKVNPKDVVSVPKYDGHTKMRVCEYTVVSEINDVVKELDKVVYTSNGHSFESDYDESEDFDSEDEYRLGYEAGQSDVEDGYEYKANLDPDSTDAFKDGYEDGFNENSTDSNECCGSGCGCAENTEADDEEYEKGFRFALEDYKEFKSYGYSLKEDDTLMLKKGYEDGWNDSYTHSNKS
jgi:hypothetical protein